MIALIPLTRKREGEKHYSWAELKNTCVIFYQTQLAKVCGLFVFDTLWGRNLIMVLSAMFRPIPTKEQYEPYAQILLCLILWVWDTISFRSKVMKYWQCWNTKYCTIHAPQLVPFRNGYRICNTIHLHIVHIVEIKMMAITPFFSSFFSFASSFFLSLLMHGINLLKIVKYEKRMGSFSYYFLYIAQYLRISLADKGTFCCDVSHSTCTTYLILVGSPGLNSAGGMTSMAVNIFQVANVAVLM